MLKANLSATNTLPPDSGEVPGTHPGLLKPRLQDSSTSTALPRPLQTGLGILDGSMHPRRTVPPTGTSVCAQLCASSCLSRPRRKVPAP